MEGFDDAVLIFYVVNLIINYLISCLAPNTHYSRIVPVQILPTAVTALATAKAADVAFAAPEMMLLFGAQPWVCHTGCQRCSWWPRS